MTAYGASTGGAPDSIPVRLARGERFDVLIMSRAGLNALAAQGLVRPDTRRDLASSSIGMAVREGAPLPDIGTPEAFAATLLDAESIGYSASVSGTYIATELYPRLGLAEELAPKSRRIVSERVAAVVARGEVERSASSRSARFSRSQGGLRRPDSGRVPAGHDVLDRDRDGRRESGRRAEAHRLPLVRRRSRHGRRGRSGAGGAASVTARSRRWVSRRRGGRIKHQQCNRAGGGRAAALAILLLVGVGTAPTQAQEDDLVALQADPAQWVMPNGNYAAWNYSPLDRIDVDNVRGLSVAWTFPLPILDSHQAAPLVVGDTMYLVTPKPNRVYALDLRQNGSVRWEYRVEVEELDLVTQRACCGAQTRGLAYADGKLFFNALNGEAIALDAATGAELWRDDPTDYPSSEVRTGAPLVAGRVVIFGVSGGDRGVRGHVTAHDIDTGEVRWRFHNLGPNADVGIGPRFRPFYADDRIPNPALDSWFGDSWRLGGGACGAGSATTPS